MEGWESETRKVTYSKTAITACHSAQARQSVKS